MANCCIIFYSIRGKKQREDDDYMVEMILDEELLEEILKKKWLRSSRNLLRTHTAFNVQPNPATEPEPLKTLGRDFFRKKKVASRKGSHPTMTSRPGICNRVKRTC
jgi:hypothetical protein